MEWLSLILAASGGPPEHASLLAAIQACDGVSEVAYGWTMRPSETTRGAAWLGNFLAEDRPNAERLLDSLEFVRLSTMRTQLLRLAHDLGHGKEFASPALLVPALSLEDISPPTTRHIAYKTFGVGGPIGSTPGSEALISHLVRQLLSDQSSPSLRWLPPTATLEGLRQAKCHSIVLLTDYSGSGRQLVDFAWTFVRNPTVRSWRSGAKLRIHAVAYASSAAASVAVRRQGSPIDHLWSVRTAPTFADRPWTRDQREAIEQLCTRTTPRRRKRDALGHRSSRGLFAMESGAPNNLPWILRRPGDSKWSPFFDDRHVPPDLADEIGDYQPEFAREELELLTGQLRLASSLERRWTEARPVTSELLWTLALLHRRRMRNGELGAAMGLSVTRVQELVETLTTLGLVDDQRVTAAGADELHANKRSPRVSSFSLTPRSDSYYPRSMR